MGRLATVQVAPDEGVKRRRCATCEEWYDSVAIHRWSDGLWTFAALRCKKCSRPAAEECDRDDRQLIADLRMYGAETGNAKAVERGDRLARERDLTLKHPPEEWRALGLLGAPPEDWDELDHRRFTNWLRLNGHAVLSSASSRPRRTHSGAAA